LTAWSSTELSKDESKNLELAVKEVLKNGVSFIFPRKKKKLNLMFIIIEGLELKGCAQKDN
jgi:hypothetical protein